MIKALVIILFISMNAFEAFIKYLDRTYLTKLLPENVRDVYDEEEFKKWQNYEKERDKVGVIKDVFLLIVNTIILVVNGYALVFNLLDDYNVYVQYFIFTLIFIMFSDVIGLPFSYYDTFVIEEKFGMNKTTKKTFWLDQIKGTVLSTVLVFILVAIIMAIFEKFGSIAFIVATVAMLIISVLATLVIVPIMRIFNKFTPLEDGSLKDRLLELCQKYGVSVKKIVVKDASRRTTKSNAFCTGFGNRKTISLDDNLVENFTEGEIVAVFAHEFAHAKYKHVLKSLPFSTFRTLITFIMLAVVLTIPQLYSSFGFNGINYYWAFSLVSFLIWPLTKAFDAVGNYISRKHEYEADAFAAREGYGTELIAALKRLNKEALSDINPHPVRIFLDYTHPSLSQRIEAINGIIGR